MGRTVVLEEVRSGLSVDVTMLFGFVSLDAGPPGTLIAERQDCQRILKFRVS